MIWWMMKCWEIVYHSLVCKLVGDLFQTYLDLADITDGDLEARPLED